MVGRGRSLDENTRKAVLAAQRSEITEYLIYRELAKSTRDPVNAEILQRIAGDEARHYQFWKRHTRQDIEPSRLKIRWYVIVAKTLGLTFAMKLMEQGEERAQVAYDRILRAVPGAKEIIDDEARHEKELIDQIDEERLRYVGSMVLGLNDALVELTGTLAGLTLALRDTHLTGTAGL